MKNQTDENTSKPEITNTQIKMTKNPNVETYRLRLHCSMHSNLDLYSTLLNMGLRLHLLRMLLMMMCWVANECVKEDDDDDCRVGGDGGSKSTETEKRGVVQVSNSAEREV